MKIYNVYNDWVFYIEKAFKFDVTFNNCNHFHNILRLFDVLLTFLFATIKTMRNITYKHGIYELSGELPNNLKLRILGN